MWKILTNKGRDLLLANKARIVSLGRITNGLLKGLEDLEVGGRLETIQTTALLRAVRVLTWRLEETCCCSNFSEKPSADADLKYSQRVKKYVEELI